MKKEQPKPYTTTPRSITDDVRSGKLSPSEWRVYQWLRCNADPFGKVSTSLMSVRNDIFDTVHVNHINNLLLSLKKKRYLYYKERRGRRGSFNVYFGDWLTTDRKIIQIDKYFVKLDGGETMSNTDEEQEPKQTTPSLNQRFLEQKEALIKGFSNKSPRTENGSPYNDTYRERENESTLAKNDFKKIRVSEYTANSYEENVCRELAIEVGEEFMNPLLSVLRKHGLGVIERAAGLYREDKRGGKIIEEPPRYLFGIVKKLLNPDD